MNFSNRLYTFGTSGNPVVQVLSLLAFGVVLIGVVLMGAVILAFVFGLAVIAAIGFSLRVWWLRRRLGRRRQDAVGATSPGRLIQAEYTVVEERSTRRTQRD
jgi:uncharacterized iron-regulated membrane protein